MRRTANRLAPDPRRVIAKPFIPGEEPGGESRAGLLVRRVAAIPESEVAPLLRGILADFGARHREFEQILERHFTLVAAHLDPSVPLSRERRLLIGACFTHEYSVEAAALFNPSIVAGPDPRRVVMSLRAVGEGHISSIEFRSGVLDAGGLSLDTPGPHLVTGARTAPPWYEKRLFSTKLGELGVGNDVSTAVLAKLPERFTPAELEGALAWLDLEGPPAAIRFETAKIIRVLAASSYVTSFPADSALSERILFPAGPNETHGMEDARFVRFVEDDGAVRFYATYTAYDGFQILPQLIETEDFLEFRISTLNGSAAQNKGMALFPRRVGGRFLMLSRRDRENLYLATSGDVRVWEDASLLYRPSHPWELLQIGNCGSPIETAAGWLVITHGVGPMRRYALGALLLDRDDPRRVLGHLAEPLLVADETEREGYVPNVLYSCGGLLHGDRLVLPYGYSDRGIGIASIALPDLLDRLRP